MRVKLTLKGNGCLELKDVHTLSSTDFLYLANKAIIIYLTLINKSIVRVFSDVLVAFLYFDICHYQYCQSNLAIENPEFSQPVVAGHFQ